jgi:hypothetical protein
MTLFQTVLTNFSTPFHSSIQFFASLFLPYFGESTTQIDASSTRWTVDPVSIATGQVMSNHRGKVKNRDQSNHRKVLGALERAPPVPTHDGAASAESDQYEIIDDNTDDKLSREACISSSHCRKEKRNADETHQHPRNSSYPDREERCGDEACSVAHDYGSMGSLELGRNVNGQDYIGAEDLDREDPRPASSYNASTRYGKSASGDRIRGSGSAHHGSNLDGPPSSRGSSFDEGRSEEHSYGPRAAPGNVLNGPRSTCKSAGRYDADILEHEQTVTGPQSASNGAYSEDNRNASGGRKRRPKSMCLESTLTYSRSQFPETFDEDRQRNDLNGHVRTSARGSASHLHKAIAASGQALRNKSKPSASNSDAEIQRLRSERNDRADQLSQAMWELKQVKSTLNNLQEAKLSSVDRFTPVVDGIITEKFDKVQIQVKVLATQLSKSTKLDVTPVVWSSRVAQHTWMKAFPFGTSELDPTKNHDFKKLAWRLVVWRWLDDAVLLNPFLAFPGKLAKQLHLDYAALFGDSKEVNHKKQHSDFLSKFARSAQRRKH